MYLPKLIPYSLIICLSIIGLSNVNAEEITAELLDKQQAMLEKAQAALPAEEKVLDEKIAALKTVNDKMLQAAAEKRQAANQKVENLRLEQTKAEAQLIKQQEAISTLTAKLDELSQYPRAELTVAHNQSIDEVQKQLAEPQQAIELTQLQIEIIKKQVELAAKQTALALKWQVKLQAALFEPMLQKRQEMLAVAKTSVETQKEALEMAETEQPNKIAQLKSVQVTVEELTKQFEKAALDKDAAEVELSNLKLESKNATASLEKKRQSFKLQQDKLEELSKATGEATVVQKQKIVELENQVKQQEQLLALDEQELNLLNQRAEQTEKQLALATRWHEKLQPVLAERKKLDLQAYMQKEQQRHLARSANLRGKLNQLPLSEESAAERQLLKIQIQEANEQSQQTERQLNTKSVEEQLTDWQTQTEKPAEEAKVFSKKKLETLQGAMDSVDALMNELHAMQALLQSKIAILDKQQNLLTKRGEGLSGKALTSNKKAQKILLSLKEGLQQELDKVPALQAKGQETLLHLEESYKEHSSLALWRMRELPTNQAEWQALVTDVSQVQGFLTTGFELTQNGVKQAFEQTESRKWYKIAIILLIWLLFFIWIIIWLGRKIKASVDKRLLGSRLLRMNALGIAVIGIVSLLLWQTQPNLLTITVVSIFLFAWLAGKLLINLLRLTLSEVDLKLYKKLRWRIVFLALVSIFVALVHIEPEGEMLALSVAALDTIDTVFMILLSLLVLPLLRLRKVMLNQLLEGMEGYWRLVISLISLLVPLAILAVSLLALIGYVTMAWMVAKQLSVFLLVLTAWLIAQGFLAVLIDFWKSSKTEESRFYELWTEDLIPLFSKLLGLILLGFAVMAIVWLNGWYSDVAMKENLLQFFGYSLFMMGEKSITVAHLLIGLVLLWAVFWFGSWSRRLTYRWVYLKITDTGVRNSLSVFTQYTVILIGLLIVLNVIGIDPTTLTVFAGAVGIGVGFGLQHIASNFMSGILLLVQRPLRKGDFLDLDGTEATVEKIGITNTVVSTRDHVELIVPNSEFITSQFSNMTHFDQIIRTNLTIGISYGDDPHVAKDMIMKVLEEIPETLPQYDVWLLEFADSSVNLVARYFVDYKKNHPVKVQSKVLFMIWDRFKEAGITIPFPQQDVHVKSIAEDKLQVQQIVS